jgi:type I restriction enzyme R subunit
MHQSEGRTRIARRLRAETTRAEDHLWALLHSRRFEDLKFRRQAPVAGKIVDFLCPELKLVLELDGGIHDLKPVEDAERELLIAEAGFLVLRSGNAAFLHNPNILLDAIRLRASEMREQSPSSERLRRPPSPPRGEGPR